MHKINMIISQVVDSLYEAIKWNTLINICMVQLFLGNLGSKPLLISAIVLVGIKIVEPIIRKNKLSLYISIALVSVVASILVYGISPINNVVGIIYFMIVLYYVLVIRAKKLYFEDEVKQIGVVLGLCALVTIFARDDIYLSSINSNALFYMFFAVFYLIRLHILTEYESAAFSISKQKNILLIDIIMIFVVILFIVVGKNIWTYIPQLILGILYAIFMFLQYVWKFSLWLVVVIQNIYLWLTGYRQGIYDKPDRIETGDIFWFEPESFFSWDLIDSLPEIDKNAYILPTFFVAFFFIVAAVLMINFIIVFYNKRKYKNEEVVMDSEKSFIFKPSSLVDEFWERFKKFFSTTSNNEVRKAYVKAVNVLYDKGLPLEKYMTPTEFERIVSAEHMDTSGSFSELTKQYNEVRYKENK
ncbi:MAG: DUF4129 domain-containing protein [Erysipelotrichales bacterium]|nr:DUF4129 domain-containing protein [Erysipelotrichales bacterium]